MLTKQSIVKKILGTATSLPKKQLATSFAPSNIALVKYWGKRDNELNLPETSSLSISLKNKGTTTTITISPDSCDHVIVNQKVLELAHPFVKKVINYINLFRDPNLKLQIETISNIPIAAGFASSASGFAALIQSLNDLFQWQLDESALSVLARLGSGSACRSLWNGFVQWNVGHREDGMDSHGNPLTHQWPDLCIGLLTISSQPKTISSTEAMTITKTTSQLYTAWPQQVKNDLQKISHAIQEKNFPLLGATAEHNALSMHATMLASNPSILYSLPETFNIINKIWQLRSQGLPLYFTQDAGPNLKLLFLKKEKSLLQQHFPQLEILNLFE